MEWRRLKISLNCAFPVVLVGWAFFGAALESKWSVHGYILPRRPVFPFPQVHTQGTYIINLSHNIEPLCDNVDN